MKASTLEAITSFTDARWGAVQLFQKGLMAMPAFPSALKQLLQFIRSQLQSQVIRIPSYGASRAHNAQNNFPMHEARVAFHMISNGEGPGCTFAALAKIDARPSVVWLSSIHHMLYNRLWQES